MISSPPSVADSFYFNPSLSSTSLFMLLGETKELPASCSAASSFCIIEEKGPECKLSLCLCTSGRSQGVVVLPSAAPEVFSPVLNSPHGYSVKAHRKEWGRSTDSPTSGAPTDSTCHATTRSMFSNKL